MTQNVFFDRQALYLRPDPARVVVRPFKPATELRDLKPRQMEASVSIPPRALRPYGKSASYRARSRIGSN